MVFAMLFLFNYYTETIRCVYFGRFVEHFYAYVIEIGCSYEHIVYIHFDAILLFRSFFFVLFIFSVGLVLNWSSKSQLKIGKSIAFAKWDYIHSLLFIRCTLNLNVLRMLGARAVQFFCVLQATYSFSRFSNGINLAN